MRGSSRIGMAWALVGVLVLAGCDRKIEPYREGEVPREPDLSRIFPAPTEPVEMGAGAAAAAPAPRGNTATRLRSEGAPSSAAGDTVSGEIRLGAGVQPAAGSVLFLIARPFGVTAGPPLAVLRIPDPRFPLAYEIGPDNVMIPSMRFEGEIGLSARLDADGNATTRDPSEPRASNVTPVTPGSHDVVLVLETS